MKPDFYQIATFALAKYLLASFGGILLAGEITGDRPISNPLAIAIMLLAAAYALPRKS